MKSLSSAIMLYLLMLMLLCSDSMEEQKIGYEKQGSMQIIKHHDPEHKISKRSTSNIVDISMFQERSVPFKMYDVYVDSSMTRLIIEITVHGSPPIASLESPLGKQWPHPKLNGTATGIFDVNINSTMGGYGKWTLRKLDASIWSVKIRGESSLDFTCQFLQGTLIQMPIIGDPIQGETYTAVMTAVGFNKIRDIKKVELSLIESSTGYSRVNPIVKGSGKYEVDKLKMLYKDFKIRIQGEDIFARTFQRIMIIKPIALLLSVPSFDVSSAQKLYENTTMDIPFTVTNKLSKEQDIDIRIHDTQHLAQQPIVLSATLKPSQNFTGKFVLGGGLLSVETTVTIMAKPYHSNYTGPSVMRTYIVQSNKTTTTSTTTSTTTAATTTSTSISQSTSASTVLNSVTHVGLSNGTSTASSAAPATNQTIGGTNAIATNTLGMSNQVTSTAGSNSLSVHGKASKTAPTHENNDESFSKEELFGAASISGMSAGVLIGVAALITIGLLFRKKKKISPKGNEAKNDSRSDHNLAWI